MKCQLTLKRASSEQRSPAAVLLPGDDVRLWVQWLTDAGVVVEHVRLLPIGDENGSVMGALCPVKRSEAGNFDPRFARYAVIADRLFVPVDGRIDPPVRDAEWRTLLPADDSLLIWHPRLELIRFEPEHQLTLDTLFRAPGQRDSVWDRARPGTAEPPRLMSLQSDVLPTLEQVLETAQGDIGTEADERFLSPPGEQDPSGFDAGRILSAPFGPLASMAEWIRSRIPESEHGTDIYDHAVRWLNQMAQRMPRIEREREREIRRLLDKLESDPDEGLKFALPMHGLPGRGAAAPGSQLGRRNVDFSLNSGHGGPVDAWQIDYQLQQQLLQRYRAACEREVNLGRFRRAAYIHAELLGDFHAAARVLEQGNHYREAAAVYRDRLSRPLDAARCLERGGLLQEAIEVYCEHNEPEKAGELYLRLDDPDSARSLFLKAVDESLEQGDHLRAAQMLRSRVNDTERALSVLRSGWPDSRQAVQCLKRYFDVLGEVGEHRRASRSIDELCLSAMAADRQVSLIETLSALSGSYPDSVVCEDAADATRQLASRHIGTTRTVSPSVMQAVAGLAAEDRLLQRDCRRFHLPVVPSPATGRRRSDRGGTRRGRLVREIPLPPEFCWVAAESVGPHVYLLGHDNDQTFVLARTGWDAGSSESPFQVTWTGQGIADPETPVLLGFSRHPASSVWIGRCGSPPLPLRTLPATGDHSQPMSVSTPGWLSDDHVGLASVGLHHWTIDTRYLLTRHSSEGVVLSSTPLNYQGESEDVPSPWVTVPVPMHARSKSVSVGLGSQFFRVTSEHRAPLLLQCPGRITAISGSALHTRERVLVVHETGAMMLFPGIGELGEIILEEEVSDLRGAVIGNGQTVLWSPGGGGSAELRQYSTSGGHCVLAGVTAMVGTTSPFPLKLLNTDRPGECAVIPREPGVPISVWEFESGS